jgi:hypothetical protein
MTTHEKIELRIRQSRALNSALLAIAGVVLGGLTAVPMTKVRPKLDSAGKPMFTPDGRPMRKTDYFANLVSQPIPYGFGVLAGFFVVRGAYIRFRPTPEQK